MRLTLKNFQIHKDATEIEIPEGETTYLEGDSDTGKSSRLRAIRLLCQNEPAGGSFVTFKQPRGTNAFVGLSFDDHVVERERGKSTNLYRLDGETFKAFGRNVPEPIANALKLSPYAFQLQGEVPFLIGMSPTESAKILSDACGLGVIDTAVQTVRNKKTVVDADIRKADILIDSAQERLVKAESELPLAAQLELTADLGEALEVLDAQQEDLIDAIDDAPEGDLIDVVELNIHVAMLHVLYQHKQDLTNDLIKMRQVLADAPQGEIYDLSGINKLVEEAKTAKAELDILEFQFEALQTAIEEEPTGTVYDIAGIPAIVKHARALADELDVLDVQQNALYEMLDDEPKGIVFDLTGIAEVVAHIRVLKDEGDMLHQMNSKLLIAICDAPKGEPIDTTELKAQRALIKVCPTCGKELDHE